MEREEIYLITNSGKVIPNGELIRCKNCKKYETVECEIWSNTHPNWYCADGKRKEDS
jgi:ribosomal protein L31